MPPPFCMQYDFWTGIACMTLSGGAHVPRAAIRRLTQLFQSLSALHRDPRAVQTMRYVAYRYNILADSKTLFQEALYDYGVPRQDVVNAMENALVSCGGKRVFANIAPLCLRISQKGGVDKAFWGPRIWNMMHYYAALASQSRASPVSTLHFYRMVICVTKLLPCGECRQHADSYLRSHSLKQLLASEQDPTQWMQMFHDAVNRRLGKPVFPHSTSQRTDRRER